MNDSDLALAKVVGCAAGSVFQELHVNWKLTSDGIRQER
jgi:hypothetical protein